MCVGSGAGLPDIMSDKEKLRLARNLVKANNKRIKNTLRIIEIALEEIEKQRLEAFLSTVRAPEKELLNKLKESLS
mgnify:CR=1 FL=1